MEFIRNAFAVIRGGILRLFLLSLRRSIKVEKKFAVYRNTKIIARKGGTISVGKNVRMLDSATISATNGGHLVIKDNVGIGERNTIKCQQSVVIESGTLFGPNVFVYDHDHKFDSDNGVNRKLFTTDEITIGKNCWICANTVILKGTNIGDNVVIGAGSIVKGDIPSGTIFIQKRGKEIN